MHPNVHDHAVGSRPFAAMSRRALLIDLGGMAAAAVILGSCSSDDAGTVDVDADEQDSTSSGSVADENTTAPTAPPTATIEGPPAAGAWRRTDLGFVSAYVLVRGGEAVIVDSGPTGSEEAMGDTLAELGSGWSDVSDVILTHRHGDHIGSASAVAAAASQASFWAGLGDVDAIGQDLGITGVGDGEQIAGLTVIATPGHTPGHISLLDPIARVLVAGDALNGENGGVVGPNSQFTPDMETANASVVALAGFDYQTIYFGHGEPVLTDGAELVAALAGG